MYDENDFSYEEVIEEDDYFDGHEQKDYLTGHFSEKNYYLNISNETEHLNITNKTENVETEKVSCISKIYLILMNLIKFTKLIVFENFDFNLI